MPKRKLKLEEEIARRPPKKKTSTGIFNNLRQPHPVEEFLPPPRETGGYPQHMVGTHQTVVGTHKTPINMEPVGTKVPTGSILKYPQVEPTKYPQVGRKKDRHKIDEKVQVKFRIIEDKYNKIKTISTKYNINIQEIFDWLIGKAEEWVPTMLKELQLVGTNFPHDMMIYNTQDIYIPNTYDDIIMAYEKFTLQKWNRRDDREGRRYNNNDIRIIEIAMISTIERKLLGNTAKQQVKSFSYFVQEINRLLEQQKNEELPKSLDDYYKYVMNTWEKRIQPLRDQKWKIK